MNLKLKKHIAIGQLEILPGEPKENFIRMKEQILFAKKKNAKLIVFPEMALPGYLIGDNWEREDFLLECEYFKDLLLKESNNITIIFGSVGIDKSNIGEDGRIRKYNAVFIASNKNWIHNNLIDLPFFPKTLMPNYREFDESRYFFDLRKLALEKQIDVESLIKPINITLENDTLKVGILLCEDGWSKDYSLSPPHILAKKQTDILLNLSCSPFTKGKRNKRNRVFSALAKELNTAILYVNAVSMQNNGKTIYTFDGDSTFYNSNGDIEIRLSEFRSICSLLTSDNEYTTHKDFGIEETYYALKYGIESFLKQTGINKIVIGISGGIDSAVSAALFASILPKENLLLVNMPSQFNSSTTKNLSKELADNLESYYTVTPIEDSVNLTKKQINNSKFINYLNLPKLKLELSSFALENIQARDRSSRILAAYASAFGGVFTCNANKTESTIGYSTLYGDHAGFLAPLADLWKDEVYELGHFLNNEILKKTIIPKGIFDIIPSAELSSNQNIDKGQGDPLIYPYHDKLFFSWVQYWNRATPADILEWYKKGILEEKLNCKLKINDLFATTKDFILDLERWWNLYSGLGIAKRIQAPPILAVSSRAFGFDHREAQIKPFYSYKYKQLKEELLKN